MVLPKSVLIGKKTLILIFFCFCHDSVPRVRHLFQTCHEKFNI